VPPGFVLTVTSTVSQTDLTVIGTATCGVAGGAFTCNYADASAPGVPQGGLLVNADSLLNVTETGFPGNTVDITFPVGMSSKYVTCQGISGPCQLTITNTPPPPPATTTTTTTTIPPVDTSIVPPTAPPETLPISIPATLPATGSSDATPLVLFGLVLLPIGATLVAITRRRARLD
jgi:LPXTG-motif cell wall-anchored protein